MQHSCRLLALALFSLTGGAILVTGQISDGNLVGLVQDQTGAVVEGAAVNLLNQQTGVERKTTTDAAGAYRFNNVLVGKYQLAVQADSFGYMRLENIDVTANRSATVNVQLQLAAVATEISVMATAAPIDTTTATIGAAYGSRLTESLPMANLPSGVLNLSLLGAGVASPGGLGVGEGPAIGGQRPRNNNFMIEGFDNNRKDTTGSNLQVSNEAVEEVSLLQNQFNAEFGRSSGGQFNTTLKSGGNQLHGSLYEYFSNRKLHAVDQSFARQGIRSNPRLDDNRFGGSLGGPILRNKLFYFMNLEYNPIGRAASPSAPLLAPTAEGLRALEQIQGISSTNLGVLKEYLPVAPQASRSTAVRGVNIPIGAVQVAYPVYENNYSWAGSLNWDATSMDQFRFRYLEQRFNGLDGAILPGLPDFLEQRKRSQRLIGLSHYHAFSPSLLNEFRSAYSRYNDAVPVSAKTFPGMDVFPNIQIQEDLNLNLGPFMFAPQGGVQNTYQLVDNLTWVKGLHTFKFGFDGRKYISSTNFIQRQRGDYQYRTLERYLLDLSPDVFYERNTGGFPYSGNSLDFFWFAQDEFKVRPNLTLSLGLRHEYKGIPEGDKLHELNSISSAPGLIEFRAPRAGWTNFAPRVGLAWSPGVSGLTVIRAGFGMAYDNYFDNLGTNAKPVQLQMSVTPDPGVTIPNFLANGGIRGDVRPGQLDQAAARAFTFSYIPDQNLPYSIQWNLGVQRVFAKDYTFESRYLGTRGVHLFVQNRLNLLARATQDRHLPTYMQQPSQAQLDSLTLTLPDLQARPLFDPRYFAAGFRSPITAFQNIGNSTYHGWATELTRRFSSGLMFKGAYTWSHTIDDSTADLFSTLLSPRRAQDFQNLRAERGNSFLDRRHRFTMASFYQSQWLKGAQNWFLRNGLGNWIFSGVYTLESPQFATVQSGVDSNLNADTAADRAIVNPSGRSGTGSDVRALTNSAGKTVAYLALDPSARYIKAGPGAYANGGRNTLPLDGINNFDVTLGKAFAFSESKSFEINASFVNALNHPQYTPGRTSSVSAKDTIQTRNHLIPGNPLFNDPSRVFDSNARMIFLTARFKF